MHVVIKDKKKVYYYVISPYEFNNLFGKQYRIVL